MMQSGITLEPIAASAALARWYPMRARRWRAIIVKAGLRVVVNDAHDDHRGLLSSQPESGADCLSHRLDKANYTSEAEH